jgi:hypothetical protein
MAAASGNPSVHRPALALSISIGHVELPRRDHNPVIIEAASIIALDETSDDRRGKARDGACARRGE